MRRSPEDTDDILTVVDGRTIALPDHLQGRYRAILFDAAALIRLVRFYDSQAARR